METINTPNSLLQLIANFPDNDSCIKHYEQVRWSGVPFCPNCGNEKYYIINKGKLYKCTNNQCYKRYNAFTGTIFENSKIPFRTWFLAIYIATNHKKGISSCQLARDLNITQKTAWFILSRIREMLKEKAPVMLNNTVEIDETYIGGKISNKHKKHRALTKMKQGNGSQNKTMVFGLLEREGNVKTIMVDKANGSTLKPLISEIVKEGSTIVTDGFSAYTGLKKQYKHETVNHLKDEYVRGDFHTNSIEGFWSQLKRGIYGIYHQVSPKHLHRYCDEFSFRYNTRKYSEGQRFDTALSQSDKRLTYENLING